MWFWFKWGFPALIVLVAILNGHKRGWRKYVINLLLALDRLGNVLLGGDGLMTISARCERGYGKRWYWTVLGRLLLLIDPDHIKVNP